MGCGQPMDAVAESVAPGADFIAKAQRYCVLQMGSSDLDDVPPGIGLGIETGDQLIQFRQQRLLQLQSSCHMNRRWEDVVCGLGPADVVVGMEGTVRAEALPGLLGGEVADHLIHVHVRLGSAAGLPDAQGELIIVLACLARLTSPLDQGHLLVVQQTMAAVHGCAALFDPCQGMNQLRWNLLMTDGEVVEGSLGLGSPERCSGDVDSADAVLLLPHRLAHLTMPIPIDNRMHALRLPC